MFRVPESNLRDRTGGNVEPIAKVGKEPLFTEREENKFVDHLIFMANIGYGYTKCMHSNDGKRICLVLEKDIENKIGGI